MMSVKVFIFITIIFSSLIVYGLPIFKIFNSINIRNVINIENENINEKNVNENNKNNKNNNFNNIEYNLIVLQNNYTINATVCKHILIYNPITQFYTGEIVISYNNNFDKNFYCKININPPEQRTSKYIQNYIYYEFNLGKSINLTCDNKKCIFKTYYEYEYRFNYFQCNIKNEIHINDEF
jgi:hypothetical protein